MPSSSFRLRPTGLGIGFGIRIRFRFWIRTRGFMARGPAPKAPTEADATAVQGLCSCVVSHGMAKICSAHTPNTSAHTQPTGLVLFCPLFPCRFVFLYILLYCFFFCTPDFFSLGPCLYFVCGLRSCADITILVSAAFFICILYACISPPIRPQPIAPSVAL